MCSRPQILCGLVFCATSVQTSSEPGKFSSDSLIHIPVNDPSLFTAWLQLLEDLEQDNQANAQQMSAKLGHVITAMEGPSARMAYV